MVFEQRQWIFILEHYFQTQLYASVSDSLEECFPGIHPPTKNTISQLVVKFRETACCVEQSRAYSPRVVTADNIEHVGKSIDENLCKLTRKHAAALNISRTSSQQILHTLKLKPYHLQLT